MIYKDSFIQQYVAAFMASFAAIHYVENCQKGWEGHPENNQPVEDAYYLACDAWKSFSEITRDPVSTSVISPPCLCGLDPCVCFIEGGAYFRDTQYKNL